ncbi:helix-turn-helix domain-containing protein [Promicromonospora sp. Populi]|uniref:helix-turn-helix domain-containing protein n=1 Tax=Promicromonospora sp. Populi TaxID=3239420 RepID=UPI0034E2D75B
MQHELPTAGLVVEQGSSDAWEGTVVLLVAMTSDVEDVLTAGTMSCPSCSGSLRPWGYARMRVLHGSGGTRRRVRPRRARCRGCEVTHVLAPSDSLPRRAHLLELVVAGLLAHHGGVGHRKIAARVGVCPDTVRRWIRRATANAPGLIGRARLWSFQMGDDTVVSIPAGTVVGDLLNAVGRAATAVRRRFGVRLPAGLTTWEIAGRVLAGRLLAPPCVPERSSRSRGLVRPLRADVVTSTATPRPRTPRDPQLRHHRECRSGRFHAHQE